ncbi:uncharacterized protein LOC114339362 [Diabrotica virgifera virgifera]|uniref:Uncharacterized protein LOC114339362 n=1 Tax=Diabrotica virgifera virgifera TaxID=50390 RepID=A0A6P7GPV6_DIAVI|nr:uncharacterized protein LOC114339362 [Diabrotica virgifera virgifera]
MTVTSEGSQYQVAYKRFMDWRKQQNLMNEVIEEKIEVTEEVLLAYFEELSKTLKATTLWKHYSILNTALLFYKGINIANFLSLKKFLKEKYEGYLPNKSKVFTSEEINKFIKEAPDFDHLLAKVILIMGVMCNCHKKELYNMKTHHLKDLESSISVEIPNQKTGTPRKFTMGGQFYKILKKYSDLRPKKGCDTSFFLNYHKGKCTTQKVGINRFGTMGKYIATWLNLENPELYTGHCFRKLSKSAHTIKIIQ